MTAFDDKFLPLATRLITKFGRPATWVKFGVNSYDATTRDVVKAGVTTYTVTVTPPDMTSNENKTNDDVQLEGATIFLAGENLAFTPAVNDKIELDNQQDVWKVDSVESIYSGSLIAAYKIILNK